MLKALIIDDEKNSRVTLTRYVKEYCSEITVVGESESVASGIDSINKYNPDVVFLDIIMSDGTGFNLMEHFKNINFKTIFVTAHNDFAIKAFKFSAVDYILKPINIDELKAAVKKLSSQPTLHLSKEITELLLDNIANQKNAFKKIVLSSQDGAHIVGINTVVRCEAKENYTIFYLTTGETILVTKTLKEYDELLTEYNFIRVHKSHLVNSNFIKRYIKSEPSYVIVEDRTQIPVSHRKKEELQSLLNKFKP